MSGLRGDQASALKIGPRIPWHWSPVLTLPQRLLVPSWAVCLPVSSAVCEPLPHLSLLWALPRRDALRHFHHGPSGPSVYELHNMRVFSSFKPRRPKKNSSKYFHFNRDPMLLCCHLLEGCNLSASRILKTVQGGHFNACFSQIRKPRFREIN